MASAKEIKALIDAVPFVECHPTRRPKDRTFFPPRLIVIHATDGSEGHGKARGTAHQFEGPAVGKDIGSTQFAADGDEIIRCGKDEWRCQGAGGANNDGLHIEQCGKANQTASEWTDAESLATIKNAALVVAHWHLAYGIPVERFLTIEEVKDEKAFGLTDHNTVSLARKESTHTDPGTNFPHDQFLAEVQRWLGGGTGPATHDEDDEDEEDDLMFVTSPHVSTTPGRTCGATLDRRSRQLILWNGARMIGDFDATDAFGVFVHKLGPSSGAPLSIGPRKAGDGVVVVFDNGDTQDFFWSFG